MIAAGRPVAFSLAHLQGFNLTGGLQLYPEFAALVFGLVTYTAAFIAEIVRAGVLAVSHGQTEAALALVFGHLIHAMELLQQPLLVAGRQTTEVGVVAQGALLLLDGLSAMLVKPVAKVAGWSGVGIVVRPCLRTEGSTIGLTGTDSIGVAVAVPVLRVCRATLIGRGLIARSWPIRIRALAGTALGRSRRRC